MALTRNLNRTGRAAGGSEFWELQLENLERLRARARELIIQCMALDPEFRAWWDDDRNIPPNEKITERISRLEKRLKELEEAA